MHNSPLTYTALLQEPVGDPAVGRVRCLTCERRCELAAGQTGWCHTRENHSGTLYTLTYGAVSSLSCNPIEKKPLYHFYPGSVALTAGSWSCNFACPAPHPDRPAPGARWRSGQGPGALADLRAARS